MKELLYGIYVLNIPGRDPSARIVYEDIITDAMGIGKNGVEIWSVLAAEWGKELRNGPKEYHVLAQTHIPEVAQLIVSLHNKTFGQDKLISMEDLLHTKSPKSVKKYLRNYCE